MKYNIQYNSIEKVVYKLILFKSLPILIGKCFTIEKNLVYEIVSAEENSIGWKYDERMKKKLKEYCGFGFF